MRRQKLPWRLRTGRFGATSGARSFRRRDLGALSPALVLLFWIAGCTRADTSMDRTSSRSSSVVAAHPFLESIRDATSKVAFSGTRHVLLSYVVNGVPKVLEYDEVVSSDGHGQFSIVPGKVASPRMSADQAAFFAILQERRDGFFFHYRDFQIRDWNAFIRNWSVHDQGVREPVAGRDCAVLEFQRKRGDSGTQGDGSGARYRAWIDPETGLVLRSQEYDANGARVNLVEFREFTLAPDLSNVSLHGDRSDPKPFDPDADTASVLGFPLLRPKILPDGYRLERAESIRAASASALGSSGSDRVAETASGTEPDRWARIAYGDGVDEVFFLQGLVPDGAEAAVSPEEHDLGTRYVRIFHVGPWTVLQGRFDRTRAIVMGKLDEDSLLRMLKSAVQ